MDIIVIIIMLNIPIKKGQTSEESKIIILIFETLLLSIFIKILSIKLDIGSAEVVNSVGNSDSLALIHFDIAAGDNEESRLE